MAALGIPIGAAFVIALYMRGTLFFVGFSWLEPILPSLVSKAAPSSPCGTTLHLYNSLQPLGSFVGASVAGPVAGFSSAPIATILAVACVLGFLLMVLSPADYIQGREN